MPLFRVLSSGYFSRGSWLIPRLGGVTQFSTLHLYHEGISCPFLGHHPFPWNFPNLQVRLVRVLRLLVRLWLFGKSRNSRKVCQNVFALAVAAVMLFPGTHTLLEAFRLWSTGRRLIWRTPLPCFLLRFYRCVLP